MNKSWTPWTIKQHAFLKHYYPSMPVYEIAAQLGRTEQAIRCEAQRLKLRKPNYRRKEKVLVNETA